MLQESYFNLLAFNDLPNYYLSPPSVVPLSIFHFQLSIPNRFPLPETPPVSDFVYLPFDLML